MEKLSLEQRLQILEDKEEIKDITYRYALYVNQGWNDVVIQPNALLDIFTNNAAYEIPSMNLKVIGIKNIIESLVEETKTVLFAMHSYSNPVIKLNGNSATGNWLFWIVSKLETDTISQVFISQDIQYLKTENGWRIQEVKLYFGNILKNKIQT